MKKTVPFTWIDAVIIIFFLLAVYFMLTRIFGHSATDLSITAAFFISLAGFLYNLNREFGEFKVKTIMSFEKVHTDLSKITADMEKLKTKLKVT